MVPKKKTTTAAKKPAAPRKPKAVKEVEAHKAETHKAETVAHEKHVEKPVHHKADGKYVWAVGRRKTSVANVRLFQGDGKSTVNKKSIEKYFNNSGFVAEALKPMQLTGTEKNSYVYVNIAGGGLHSQAKALAHGLARAIILASPDSRKVLKKNGMLTRDSRMKERKKPGLKRARRGPQWAKR